MSELPVCEYRFITEPAGLLFCRHTRVHAPHNLVTADVCRQCSFCDTPCQDPRPLPEEPIELPQTRRGVRRPPALHQQAWSVATALVSFVADGFRTVSQDQYAERLAICDDCEERTGNRCVQCGCRLLIKARGRVFQCPLGKWPDVPRE